MGKLSKTIQSIKSRFKNLSINKKFTVSLLCLVIIPLIVTFWFVNQTIMKQITSENCEKNLEILKQTKNPINYMINDLYYISKEILGDSNLQEVLGSKGALADIDKAKIDVRYDIQALLDSREYITRVSIFDSHGIIFQFGGYLTEESNEYNVVLDELKGSPLWIPARMNQGYIYQRDRIYEVSMLRAINDIWKYNSILSYEKINISEDYLCSLYQGIATEGTQNIIIIDENGWVVSSLYKELLGKNIAEEPYLRKMQRYSEGYFFQNSGELISYYKIQNPNWTVIKIDDKNFVLNKSLINAIFIFSIALILFFSICFMQIQKKTIIYPVGELSREVKKFKEGRYEIEHHNISKDEIGELNTCFVDMGKYIQDLIEKEYKSRIREKEAQLMSLHSQINPHFLYNALDSIRWMAVKEKQKEIAVQIMALSNLFRHALNEGKEMTTVREELDHLEAYLTIQKNRFGEKLEIEITADSALNSQTTLKLILQPLVENAIIHGLEKKIGRGKICVVIEKRKDMLYFMVRDNGLGTNESVIQKKIENQNESNDIFALDNINQRIKLKYGMQYGIIFHSQIGIGTVVEIEIPFGAE